MADREHSIRMMKNANQWKPSFLRRTMEKGLNIYSKYQYSVRAR